MASRTSASVGMLVSLATLGLLSLVLFVLTVVFAANTNRLTKENRLMEENYRLAVAPSERDDRWEELKRLAGGRQGVVRYLDASLSATMQKVSGSRRETLEGLTEKIEQRFGPDAPPLLNIIEKKDGELASVRQELAAKQRDLDAALADLQATNDRMKRTEEEHRDTIAALNAEIDGYKAELDSYRESVTGAQEWMRGEVDQIRTQLSGTIAELEAQNSRLANENAILKEQLAKFRAGPADETLKPSPEETLADGSIVGVNPGARQVYISRGRNDRVVQGMSFEVYSQGTSIARDAEGNYPPGKATIEVIRIEEKSSLCRIIREVKGNIIIEGDVIANALYDPRKKYKFVVFGSFDTNADNIATPQEAADIKAVIDNWGGLVTDDLGGDTDFLVLGERPVLPPEPKSDSPPELISRYLHLKRDVQRYDELFAAAQRTSIPVLNQNRLMTLTGLHAQQ